MASRRPHRKSRHGCIVCKRRRVKCDEQGPPCNRCIAQRLKCSYITDPSPTNSLANQPTPQSTSEPCTAPTNHSVSRHLLELHLLHHWTAHTYRTFATESCNQEDEHRKWQVIAVREALNHPFLLSAIFAVTSMHISITEAMSPNLVEVSQYRVLALEYHDEASKKFRANMHDASTTECHTAAFVFSILTMAMSLALTQWSTLHASEQSVSNSESSIQHIKTFFQMIQGTRSIFNQSYKFLRSGPFCVRDNGPLNDRSFPPELAHTELDLGTDLVIATLFAENEETENTILTSSKSVEGHRKTYHETLNLLRRAFAGVQADGHSESTMLWAAYLTGDFLENLKADEPMALLIVMHWGVLLHRLRNAWWIGPISRVLVSEISHFLLASTKGREMQDRVLRLVAWPRKQVGLGPSMQRTQLEENMPTTSS